MKKVNLLLLMMVVFVISSFGQMIEYYQNENIKIEYIKQECPDLTNGISNIYVFLKFTNKTSAPIDISYNICCTYQNGAKTYKTNGENIKHSLQIPSKQSVEGNCDNRQKNLRVYAGSKIRQASVLKEFEVTNIEIKKSK